MENQEKNNVVEMEPVNTNNSQEEAPEGSRKVTYEELVAFCNKTLQDNKVLIEKLQQANKVLRTIERLDYLLRIVDIVNSSGKWSFSDEFIIRCYSEIETILTPPAKEEEDKEEN